MNITELKEIAEKATPGPWVAAGPSFGYPLPRYLTSVVVDREEDDDYANEICRAPGGCESICTSDMDFIGAANPAAILELITQLEDAQGEIRALRAAEAGLVERVKELEDGIRNLAKVKGRFHTEQAFKALVALLEKKE